MSHLEQQAREMLAAELRKKGLSLIERWNDVANVTANCAIDAITAALQAQQPGAQAVAWRWRLRDGDCWSYTETDPAKHPDYFGESWQVEAVYTTPPPPLPEGVSEEDVTALVECLWDVDIGYEEAKKRARMILESFLARLAARGEEGVQS